MATKYAAAASVKLTDGEKADLAADVAFAALLKRAPDAAFVNRAIARLGRNGRLVMQDGDMKGKRPSGAKSHEHAEIVDTIVRNAANKGRIIVSD